MTTKTRIKVIKIVCELQFGASRQDIITKLGAEFGLSPGRMSNLITLAYKEIEKGEIKKKELYEQGLQTQMMQAAEKAARTKIASEQETESYLTEIIRGERMEEKVVSTPHGFERVQVMPRVADVLKAISLFRGSLPPKYYVLKSGKYVPAEEVQDEDEALLLDIMQEETVAAEKTMTAEGTEIGSKIEEENSLINITEEETEETNKTEKENENQ